MRPPGATAAEALSRLLVLPAAPAPSLRSATGGRLPFLSARLVELALGPFGPGPQVGPCFLQHRGAGLGGGLDAGQLGACSRSRRVSSASAAWTRACMASRSSSRSRAASARTWSSIRAASSCARSASARVASARASAAAARCSAARAAS